MPKCSNLDTQEAAIRDASPIFWKKGDPYPQDWPSWLKEADIETCDVEIQEGYVIWHGGTWQDGVWENGIWENGIWQSGTWNRGIWRGGTWENGVWHDGIWSGGVWRTGTWNGPHPRVHRFGWEASGSHIEGWLDGYIFRRTPEEWQPYFLEMEPEKVAEYRALLFWMQELTRIEASKGEPPRTYYDFLLD